MAAAQEKTGSASESVNCSLFNGMASFSIAQQKIKRFEGGYQNLVSDKGNFVDGILIGTNYGITAKTLKSYLGHTPSVAEMKGLNYNTALDIYRKM